MLHDTCSLSALLSRDSRLVRMEQTVFILILGTPGILSPPPTFSSPGHKYQRIILILVQWWHAAFGEGSSETFYFWGQDNYLLIPNLNYLSGLAKEQ